MTWWWAVGAQGLRVEWGPLLVGPEIALPAVATFSTVHNSHAGRRLMAVAVSSGVEPASATGIILQFRVYVTPVCNGFEHLHCGAVPGSLLPNSI